HLKLLNNLHVKIYLNSVLKKLFRLFCFPDFSSLRISVAPVFRLKSAINLRKSCCFCSFSSGDLKLDLLGGSGVSKLVILALFRFAALSPKTRAKPPSNPSKQKSGLRITFSYLCEYIIISDSNSSSLSLIACASF